jgi:hypothetical protein
MYMSTDFAENLRRRGRAHPAHRGPRQRRTGAHPSRGARDQNYADLISLQEVALGQTGPFELPQQWQRALEKKGQHHTCCIAFRRGGVVDR